LCRNIETAADILKGILIIIQSETKGNTRERTIYEEYKIKIFFLNIQNMLPIRCYR